MKTPLVSIGAVSINQDNDGRYSLNDLHQAAGGEKRHSPNYWLDVQQTKDLIAELAKPLNEGDTGIPVSREIKDLSPVVAIRGGKGKQGTFVVRELVYSYAMWISPAFHLKVIRTFDAVMTGAISAADTLIPSEQQLLHEAVDARISALPEAIKGKAKAEIWSRLHRKFRVAQYAQLPRTQIMDAILYITRMDLRCAPGQAIIAAPVQTSPQITADDHKNIQRVVWWIAHGMRYEKGWIAAVWHALRQATNCPAPHRFEERHLPAITEELSRILVLVSAFNAHRTALEKELVSRMVRGREESAPFITMMKQEEEQWTNQARPWIAQIESWCQKDIDQIQLRILGGLSNHSDCAEPVPA